MTEGAVLNSATSSSQDDVVTEQVDQVDQRSRAYVPSSALQFHQQPSAHAETVRGLVEREIFFTPPPPDHLGKILEIAHGKLVC